MENLRQIASLLDGSVDKDDEGRYWISTQFGALRIQSLDAKAVAFALLEDKWANGELNRDDMQRLSTITLD